MTDPKAGPSESAPPTEDDAETRRLNAEDSGEPSSSAANPISVDVGSRAVTTDRSPDESQPSDIETTLSSSAGQLGVQILDQEAAPEASPQSEVNATLASPALKARSADVQGDGIAPSTDLMEQLSPSDRSWSQVSSAVAIFSLLAMALTSWYRLSTGQEWIVDFLRSNKLPMEQRDLLLWQLLAAGGLGGLGTLVYVIVRRKVAGTAELVSRWAWFLSPLMLLPALPVIQRHEVWKGRHEDLVPIVLFLGLLVERLVTQSLRNVPSVVALGLGEMKRNWSEKKAPAARFIQKHGWLLLVVSGCLFYAAFMSFYTVRWHRLFGTATFDLGINNNLIYGGLHGKFNQSTVIFPEDPQKYIANHVKLGLYFFLPIYSMFPRAETLLVIQSTSLGLGALPLFLFARRHVKDWQAAILALCYLAYYPMHGANFYEMKMVPTSAAFVLTAIWALDAKHWKTFGVFFGMTLLMREDMPIPLAVIGVLMVLTGYRAKAGAIMSGIAIFWFVLIRFKVMMDVGSWWFPNMYEDLWSEPETGFRSVLKTLLSNPAFVLKHIFVEDKLWYMLHLLVPLVFVPVRRWYLWAALVPGAILTLLVTNYDPPVMFSFQYVMHWAPYLFTGAAVALAAISREDRFGRRRAAAAAVAMAVASFALSYNYGAFPARDGYLEAGYHKIRFGWSDEAEENYQNVQKMLAQIPDDASVASTERVGAHLSSRVGFYTLRRGSHDVDYIVARRKGMNLDKTGQTMLKALQSGEYGQVGKYDPYLLFKKGADTSKNQSIIKAWRLDRKGKKKSKKRKSKSKSKGRRDAPSLKTAKNANDSAKAPGASNEKSTSDSPTKPTKQQAPRAAATSPDRNAAQASPSPATDTKTAPSPQEPK